MSEYYYPNVWGRSILTAAEEILGAQGVNALLNLALVWTPREGGARLISLRRANARERRRWENETG